MGYCMPKPCDDRDTLRDWRVLAFAAAHSGNPAMAHLGAALAAACDEIEGLRADSAVEARESVYRAMAKQGW